MTQKFTAEEVREYAAALRRALQDYLEGRSTFVSLGQCAATAPGMLEAYADTLSKPADSGRVGDAMVERAREAYFNAASVEDGVFTDPAAMRAAISAALAAQGQGEAVAWLVTRDHDRTFPHVYISESSADAVVEWVTLPPFANKVPLYTAPPASPAGVPELTLGQRAVAAELLRCFTAWEPGVRVLGNVQARDAADLLRHLLAAAPSAPEGGHIDRARFEKAPCYLCGYNGPGYYQPGTHSCAAKYHATQPKGE